MSHRHINPDGSLGAQLGDDITLDFDVNTSPDIKITKNRVTGTDEAIRSLALQASSLPEFLKILLYNKKVIQNGIYHRVKIIIHTKSVHLLTLAAGENVNEVKIAVALNNNTPIEILNNLSKDRYATVRRHVAFNKFVPNDTLIALSKDKISAVRELAQYKLLKRQKCK